MNGVIYAFFVRQEARLGVYEITAHIGEGGMGQVYRALDTKLNREVALKVLPDVFAADADRLARFTRAAPTLASLNHPHIAAIYGLEELFFDITGTMTAVRVPGLDSGVEPGPPTRLFNGLISLAPHNFDVADAGRRFLVLLAPGSVTGEVAPITVVVNWKSGLPLGRSPSE